MSSPPGCGGVGVICKLSECRRLEAPRCLSAYKVHDHDHDHFQTDEAAAIFIAKDGALMKNVILSRAQAVGNSAPEAS